MRKFLMIKIGGSRLMKQLITQTLKPHVYRGEKNKQIKSIGIGSTLMFTFMSDHSIDELMYLLKDIAVNNYFITEVTDATFCSNLSDSVNYFFKLNKFKRTVNKMLDEMDESELKGELKNALDKQMYERAADIRDMLIQE